ncbi:cation diffusion facilitator family transporter [Brevundimonas balnearis]|uniref:Cation diffusion facilitator family transporter n=1 Tax=Brevundimonas balnearis TaxID=1572858 RepID=A0ABV6R1R1_9CAUL
MAHDAHAHHHGHPGHGHGHHHHHHHAPADTGDWRYLLGLTVNLVFVGCEAAAGLISGSTALLADAGHNLSDVLGLAMAGGAAWLARRVASERRTYGYGKATVLAALANAVLLIVACAAIGLEAVERLADPQPVQSGVVMAVAALGFVINLGTALLFLRDRHADLNARGAYLHMLADAAVSIGVVIVGGVVLLTGWTLVDPIASLAIVAVILWGTWGLLRDSVDMALDAAPASVNVAGLKAGLEALEGVERVHDLHVWPLSTTKTALTAHLVHDRADPDNLLCEAQALARAAGVDHTTLQLETRELPDCPGC